MEILEENLQGHPERMTKEKDFVWAKVFTKAKHRANDASHNVHRPPLIAIVAQSITIKLDHLLQSTGWFF